MLAVSLLCQVRAARNYASLYVNNVQMFFEVTIKGQFEKKSAWILQSFWLQKKGKHDHKKVETNKPQPKIKLPKRDFYTSDTCIMTYVS